MGKLREAVDKAGGVSAAAKACGVSIRGVYKWLEKDCLPRTEYTGETRHAEALSKASGGAFTREWLLDHCGPRSAAHRTRSRRVKSAS